MQSIDEILAAADDPAFRRIGVARISMVRQELLDEHARLEALLPSLTTDTIDSHPDRLPTAQRLAAIEAEIEASTVEFRFAGIGHRAWADLLKAHPPTRDQKRDMPQLDHNPETFPHAALAASSVDPVMTVEQVHALESKPVMDVKAWTLLWTACLEANVGSSAPKSLAAGLILRQSGASAPRRTTTEPPAPSSSAGS